MKIVVSVDELAREAQTVIDSMRRSRAPVLIGETDKPVAVLLSVEEYERLQRQPQANEATQSPAPAPASAKKQPAAPPAVEAQPVVASIPASETTQPIARLATAVEARAAVRQPAAAEVIPAVQHSDIAQRAAAAIQADRAVPAESAVVSQRQDTLQPDPTLGVDRSSALRGVRLTKPLPKPPRPLTARRADDRPVISLLVRNWQTIALIIGVLLLAIVGFALIVNAIS